MRDNPEHWLGLLWVSSVWLVESQVVALHRKLVIIQSVGQCWQPPPCPGLVRAAPNGAACSCDMLKLWYINWAVCAVLVSFEDLTVWTCVPLCDDVWLEKKVYMYTEKMGKLTSFTYTCIQVQFSLLIYVLVINWLNDSIAFSVLFNVQRFIWCGTISDSTIYSLLMTYDKILAASDCCFYMKVLLMYLNKMCISLF